VQRIELPGEDTVLHAGAVRGEMPRYRRREAREPFAEPRRGVARCERPAAALVHAHDVGDPRREARGRRGGRHVGRTERVDARERRDRSGSVPA
jgi:hypothetical protein